MKPDTCIAIGALSAGIAVALGAFGAHGLKDSVPPEDLDIWKTGVLYHVFHALALILVGLHARGGATPKLIAWSFLAGSVIFAGTLYGIVLTDQRWLGAITPIGGGLMIVGWVSFFWHALRAGKSGS